MKPPWDRQRRALPRLPKGQVRVQVKVIEVGGGAATYRRSKSFTVRDATFKDVCGILELLLPHASKSPREILGSLAAANPPSGGLTPEPPPEYNGEHPSEP